MTGASRRLILTVSWFRHLSFYDLLLILILVRDLMFPGHLIFSLRTKMRSNCARSLLSGNARLLRLPFVLRKSPGLTKLTF